MVRVSEQSPTDPPDGPPGDVFSEIPLFREIQRVLMSSSGPVNWELARQVGIATASWGAEDPSPTEEDRAGLERTVRAAELAVADFTLLPNPTDMADVRAFRRGQWVEANITGLRIMIDAIAAKLSSSISQMQGGLPGLGLPGMETLGLPDPSGSGGDAASDMANPEMMTQVMNAIAPLLMGAQVGTVLGQLGQRVLGQFDLAVPRPSTALYFVIPNIARFEQEWELPSMEFRAWVALHEVTHRFEFAQPWVGDHFLALVRDLVEHAEVDLAGLQRRLEGMDFANPSAVPEALEGVGNLFGEATSAEQRLRMARVQAFVAAAEGFGDHVVDSVGRTMLSSFVKIDEALRRYREGRPGDQALERLLGLEMTVEQYRVGREFCETVTERTDQATLSRMWGSADSLPSMPELEEPTLWLSRMA
jgi:putative hydrolase